MLGKLSQVVQPLRGWSGIGIRSTQLPGHGLLYAGREFRVGQACAVRILSRIES